MRRLRRESLDDQATATPQWYSCVRRPSLVGKGPSPVRGFIAAVLPPDSGWPACARPGRRRACPPLDFSPTLNCRPPLLFPYSGSSGARPGTNDFTGPPSGSPAGQVARAPSIADYGLGIPVPLPACIGGGPTKRNPRRFRSRHSLRFRADRGNFGTVDGPGVEAVAQATAARIGL